MKVWRLQALFVGCLLLCACGESALKTTVEDYQQRLERLLQQPLRPPPQAVFAPAPVLPQTLTPTDSISLINFLKLQGCQLNSLIAERNTTLGRIQYPSARLAYDLRLLQGFSDCREHPPAQFAPDDLQQLSVLIGIKQHHAEVSWRRLIQDSEELRQGFWAPNGMIRGDVNDGLAETETALSYLLTLADTPESLDLAELETQLAQLRKFTLPSRMAHTSQYLDQQFSRLTPWLQRTLPSLSCGRGQSTTVNYLANVFALFFIQQIQPLASKLNQYHYRLAPLFQQLAEHRLLTQEYKAAVETTQLRQFERYKQQTQLHLQVWQSLFQRCQINPTSLNPLQR